MSTSEALKSIFAAARPLVETWLDTAEQIAALRETATNAGLDWSQVKALLKAQIQDERDEAGDGKRVRKLIEKAEFACAYADMLGLGNMNEKNISAPPHDPNTGEILELATSSDIPDWDDLLGIAPDATGDLSSEAFVRELRDNWMGPDFSEPAGPALPRPEQQAGAESPTDASAPAVLSDEFPDLPEFLRRKRVAA